jgi:predicted nucleic acid-binding protein
MPAKIFFDTNILIYAITSSGRRSDVAEKLLAAGGVVSSHVLNELVAVARRKLGRSWEEIAEALAAIRILCPLPVPITIETHEAAVRVAQQYGYQIYDALVIAAALEAGCDTLYSEDLQDGQKLDGRLTIDNPFKASPGPSSVRRRLH